MISDAESIFMYLLAIYIFSLMKCIFRLFTHFEIGVFILLSFESSLYILDTSPLLDTLFANISPQAVACLFIFLIMALKCKSF